MLITVRPRVVADAIPLVADAIPLVADAIPLAADATPPEATPVAEPSRPIGQLHRAVSLLAVISLFVGTLTSFDVLIWSHPVAGITIMVGYGCALILAILVVVTRGRRLMLAVDIGILIDAVVIRLPSFLTSFHHTGLVYANDEGALIDFGGGLLRRGIDPYTMIWPGAYAPGQPGFTQTMAGGVVDHYDYPPMPAIMSAAAHAVSPGAPAAIVAALSLLAATILMFVLLPSGWRSGATLLFIGLGIYLMPFARQGYPEVMAFPFLIVAVNRWTRIGLGGRLGGLGIASAIGLGVAICTQQLAWFLAPFLIVGILLCRLGDQPRRVAWALIARYVLIVGAVFALITGPFAIWNWTAWSSALLTPVTMKLVPHGQGLIGVAYYLFSGSGALQLFSFASAALACGLLLCFTMFIRRLGPAMSIMPWPALFLSVRSSDKYFYVMMPLWLLCLATVHHREFAGAFQPGLRIRGHRPLQHPLGRALIVALALAPALILSCYAIATPQPLHMRIENVESSPTGLTAQIDVEVTNVSDRTITPHFALSNSQAMSRFWLISAGPQSLRPGQSALFVITPSTGGSRRSLQGPRIMLRAVSDTPETLSSVEVAPP